MENEKIKAEIRAKALLIIIPFIIAFGAGGMFPVLIDATESFSLVGAIVWGAIIALLDFKMITLMNPNKGIKLFRFMMLVLTATMTSVIIDSYVFKPDVDKWKLENPPADNQGAINKAQKDYDIALANYNCEKSGKKDCGVESGVKITGSGKAGCGTHCQFLQKVATDAHNVLIDIRKNGDGGLLYDFDALKGVVADNNTALGFWIFFMLLIGTLEGIVLFLMHTESKLTKIAVLGIEKGETKRNGEDKLAELEAIEKQYHENK